MSASLVHFLFWDCWSFYGFFPLLIPCCRSEQGLELDLLLLQCCGALAPADLYVKRILERFGLSNYLSLNPERPSEYITHLLKFSNIVKVSFLFFFFFKFAL